MSGSAQVAGKKRKAHDGPTPKFTDSRKRNKRYEAYNIATETADAALSKTGELNIASFVKNREFEINALEKSMRKARKGLMSRAFQQLPRQLRRRTASHNVKKVPRRLRGRAAQEMKEDNTPTVTSKSKSPSAKLRLRLENAKALRQLTAKRKLARRKKKENKVNTAESDPAKQVTTVRLPRIKKNKLALAPTATTKYKRRQVNKTWLPTHQWHTKRAQMTRPVEPLWRMAIALSPTEKCYRSSHRASGSRGCIAWDMSYMSTIGCMGTEFALEAMLKAIGVSEQSWSGIQFDRRKFRPRFAVSWVREQNQCDVSIAPVEILWSPRMSELSMREPISAELDGNLDEIEATSNSKRRKTKLNYQLLLRVHPSAFAQLWTELLKVAKQQKPQVLLEDLRFEIGGIDVTGPGSTEALAGVLKPLERDTPAAKIWSTLASLSNPALLPRNAMLTFDVGDPRLHHPPKQIPIERDETKLSNLNELIVDWPLDKVPSQSTLFSHRSRYLAARLPSQKAINRQKTLAVLGQSLPTVREDHRIPIILLARRSEASTSGAQGTWTVLAPWNCIESIWRSLMYYPMSSGGTPRFGGLNEKRQVAFEQSLPWFPGDYPGSMAGQAWERTESEKRFDEWMRKPPSKRLSYARIDLGLDRRGELGQGWACDWDFLFGNSLDVKKDAAEETANLPQPDGLLLTQRQRKAAKVKAAAYAAKEVRRRNSSSPESDADKGVPKSDLVSTTTYTQILPALAASLLKDKAHKQVPTRPCLMTVRITFLTRGTPLTAARIYRLPKAISEESSTTTTSHQSVINHVTTVPSNFVPPSAQPSPPILPSTISTNSPTDVRDLRSRWLALDTITSMYDSKPHVGKLKTNRHQLPPKQTHLPVPSLRHINVLPKNAPAEVVEQFGAKPPTEAEKQAKVDELLRVRLEEEKVWETHVPCPDQHDLVGFVTSGGYNLSQGKGTAIGGLWIQKILEGWQAEDAAPVNDVTTVYGKVDKRRMKQKERERRLCVVRNAGESIGRLAIWELCK